MSEQVIGPVILDIEGLELTQEDMEIISHPHVGGVIFFSRNYKSPEQLSQLVQNIRAIRKNLLLCVDQEGGRVQRFINGLTRLPPLRTLGDLIGNQRYPLDKVLQMSEKLGALMALEIRSLGVDLSFAPVLDLDLGMSTVIGNRAFHGSPQVVSDLATAYVKGMSSAGMQAVGKHFPGHGSVSLDSHFALPEDLRSFEEITADLLPFQALAQAKMAGMMPAHIVYPNIDPNPIGFSAYWLQTVLRKQLKFAGTIVSDDLSMEGATVIGTYPERAQKALEAGCDFVLICNNRKGALSALEAISSEHDQVIQQRRLALLGRFDVPSYQQLMDTDEWETAYEVIEELMQMPDHEAV